jgi:DNA modification methylase
MFPINQVMQGDCTRVLRTLPNEVVDLVVTDPPYGVRYQDGLGRTIANDDDPSRVLGAFRNLHRVMTRLECSSRVPHVCPTPVAFR